MAGVTASYVKELLRRAVLEALTETAGPLTLITSGHLGWALDDVLDSAQSVTRALLGVPTDQSSEPHGHGGGRAAGGHGRWFAYGPPHDAAYDPRAVPGLDPGRPEPGWEQA